MAFAPITPGRVVRGRRAATLTCAALLAWAAATPPVTGADRAAHAAGDDIVSAAVADARLVVSATEDEEAANRSVLRLSEDAPEAKRAAVPLLLEAMASDQLRVRQRVYHALSLLGPEADPAVPRLLRRVQDAKLDWHERSSAILAVGRLGRRSDEVVPVLAKELESANENDRHVVLFALYYHGPAAEQAMPTLRDVIRRRDGLESNRSGAARVLQNIGRAAAPAVPDLLRMLRAGTGLDRLSAAEALGGIGPVTPNVVPALVAALADAEEDVRGGALRAIGDIAPADPAAVDAIRTMRPTKKADLALAYARVRLGDAEVGLNRLGELARAEPPSMEVFETLARLKKPAVPLLVEVVQSGGAGSRWAIEALGTIGPDAAPAVPSLLALLRGGRQPGPKAVRFDAAVKALGQVGPPAREALPQLTDLSQKHPNMNVRRLATAAVHRITL